MTPLDRLVARHVAERTTWTLGAATEQIAEEIAREILADESFRTTFKAMVEAHSRTLFETLMRQEKTRRPRRRRRRPGAR
jgi:hypothetical protein